MRLELNTLLPSMVSILTVIRILIFHSVYLICYAFVSLFQTLAKCCTSSAQDSECCEVRDIVWRSRISHGDLYFNIHFMTVHDRFEEPKYVLKDTVLVYSLTDTHVILVEFDKAVHKACTVANSVILMSWAFENAKKQIRMPIDTFQNLVEQQLGKRIQMKVVLLGNQARCGSTLLCKVLGRMCPDVVCMSEPGYILALTQRKNKVDSEEYQQLLSSVLRFGCRPVADKQGYFIKMTSMGMIAMDQVMRACPEIKFLYLERKNNSDLLYSYHRMLSSIAITRLMLIPLTFRLFGPMEKMTGSPPEYVWSSIREHIGQLNTMNMFEGSVYLWAMTVKLECYLKSVLPPYPTVVYEELLQTPETVLKGIAQFCEFKPPYDMVSALDGFRGDSQEGTHLSRESLKQIKRPDVNEEMKQRISNFCTLAQLPSVF